VGQQGYEHRAEGAPRGVGTGGEQQPQEAVEALLVEPLPVDLRADEIADHVVARRTVPVLDDRHEVLGHARGRVSSAVRVVGTEDHLRAPVLEVVDAIERHAHHRADDLDPVAADHLGDELGAPTVTNRPEEITDGRFGELALPAADRPRRERLLDERAVLTVLVGVERDEHLLPGVWNVVAAQRRRECRPVAQHAIHVMPACDVAAW
jgi:hypothetical protein